MIPLRLRGFSDRSGGSSSFNLMRLLFDLIVTIWISVQCIQANSQPFTQPSPSSLELSYHTTSIHPPHLSASLTHPTHNQHWLRWRQPTSTSFNHSSVTFILYADWFRQDQPLYAAHSTRTEICQIKQINEPASEVKSQLSMKDELVEWLECEITDLPREIALTFMLIVLISDDNAIGSTNIPRITPFLQLTLPRSRQLPSKSTPVIHHPHKLSANATANITRIVNDTEVRQDFILFKNLTSQLSWDEEPDWGRDDLSICDWASDVITCNPDRTLITGLALDPVSFIPGLKTSYDLNFIFQHLHSLTTFASGFVPFLTLDLSQQVNIKSIEINQLGICEASRPSSITPLYLPFGTSTLETLDLGSTCYSIVNVMDKSFPYLKVLNVGNTPIPFPISIIADTMPSLIELFAEEALESKTPDGAGRSGSTLTNYWLENLNTLHPLLITLALSGGSSTRLEFDATFPIMHSESLLSFSFRRNSQVYPSAMNNETLKYLPQLQSVAFSYLSNMILPLTLFEYASSSALFFIDLTSTPVVGSLESLKSHTNISFIWMSQTKLTGELPQSIASYWPQLTEFFVDSNDLIGPVPSFANLPHLAEIDLHSNAFSSLPNNFLNNSLTNLFSISLSDNQIDAPLFTLNGIAPVLQTIDISHNSFFGELSTLFTTAEQVQSQLPSLAWILANNNKLTGNLPVAIWSLSINDNNQVLLNSNFLEGSIPSPPVPTVMHAISLDNNPDLNGPFPQNLTAVTFSVAYTSLSGPVTLSSFTNPPTESLNLAFTQLSCPLDLSTATSLVELDIQSARFGDCDMTNQTEMNVHWDVLQILDLSNNDFKPFILIIYPSLTILHARSCGVTSFAQSDYGTLLNLQTFVVDNNALTDYTSARSQRVFLNALSLSLVSFQNCSMTGLVQAFVTEMFSYLNRLSKLLLGSNNFIGEVPVFLFADNSVNKFALPTSLEEFDLSNNPQLTGNLPPTAPSYTALQVIDLSDTGVTGSLPESWSTFVNLQRLSVDHTQLVCSSQDTYPLPPWISISTLTSPSTSILGAHCPHMNLRSSSLTVVSMDEEYYHHSLCTCDEKYFGSGSTCQLCPNGCSCVGDQIQNCFPIVSTSNNTVTIPFIISCPLTVTGESLCNPHNVRWNLTSSTMSGVTDSSSADSSSFCYTGHTGRGCTKCIDGYFSSGRWCLKCGSNGLHIFIVFINLVLLLLLIGIIYSQLPAPTTAVIQMEKYFSVNDPTATLPPSLSLHGPHRTPRPSRIHIIQQNTTRSTNSPLKLLVFHCQQLGLILHTATSQPQLLTGFLSLVSSGSSGFSLASLVSLECLNYAWSIQQQVWMSLLAPTLVGLVCLLIYLFQQYRQCPPATTTVGLTSPSTSNADPSRDTIQLGPDSSGHDSSTTASAHNDNDSEAGIVLNFPRLYGVCLALLYFFLFPCAQTVLSAIACTDARQYDGSSSDTSSLYLNLLPWIACDSAWRSKTLPPAIVGVIVWIVAFPIFTTLLTRYLIVRIRVTKDIHLWPLCSDLFTRFKPKYWYYEQILLARRLSLVLAITIIPSDSLYLSVTLFSIIQLSALVQHLMEPYQSVWLNRGELVSLYLLLLNYITALVLHDSTLGANSTSGTGHSLDTWSVILFLANLLFVFVLIGGLFLSFQNKLLRFVNKIQAFFDEPFLTKLTSRMNDHFVADSDTGMIELNPYHDNHPSSLPHVGMNGTQFDASSSPHLVHGLMSNGPIRSPPRPMSTPLPTNHHATTDQLPPKSKDGLEDEHDGSHDSGLAV